MKRYMIYMQQENYIILKPAEKKYYYSEQHLQDAILKWGNNDKKIANRVYVFEEEVQGDEQPWAKMTTI